MTELNKYSKTITQDPTQPAARAMLYGIGLTDEDLAKAQVGIVSMGYDGNTCNMHLNDLSTKYEGTENGLKYQYKYLALRDIYNALTQYEE